MSLSRQRFLRWARIFGWVHQGIGVFGGVSFFIGSVLFLWKDPLQLIGVWLFIFGSFGMLIGNVGTLLLALERND